MLKKVLPLLFIFNISIAYSQCTVSTGTPIVNETFGSGPNFGPPLPGTVTNLQYLQDYCPNDGQYTIVNYTSGCWSNGWHTLTDHTGNPNGYFMLINASYAPSDFYTDTISGLCPGTTYEFSSWVINMANNTGGILPNITFTIEKTDGTILASDSTGYIPVINPATWTKYAFYFKTPPGITTVKIRMHNNAPGGGGNDLAIDDIGFSPSGPLTTIAFNDIKSDTLNNLCYNKTITLSSNVGSCYIENTYQWQSSSDGKTWADIPGATSSTYNFTVTAQGVKYYRLNVSEIGNIENVNCRVNSNVLTVISSLPKTVTTTAGICFGKSFQLSGKTYNKTGTYIDTLRNIFGCDSLINTLDLTVNPAPTVTKNVNICAGQSYEGHTKTGNYTDTIAEPGGCDSLHILNLKVNTIPRSSLTAAICAGQSYLGYTKSGTYVDTLASAAGCDSIRTINLTVNPASSSLLTTAICAGQSYAGYTKSGTYVDTLRAANGCDSIRTINLTVNAVSKSALTAAICPGQSYLGYTKSGTYIDTLTAANGCDSIRTIKLTVNPITRSNIVTGICQGNSYLGYSNPGTYIDTLMSSNGCDSIRTLKLSVYPVQTSTVNAAICQGQNYGGHTKNGTYVDTLASTVGCDSIRTLNLTVYDLPKPNLGPNLSLCFGDTVTLNPGAYSGYLWQDKSTMPFYKVTSAGIYWVNVADENGCTLSDTITVQMTNCKPIKIPNTFSPNNDGINDTWRIDDLSIYNDCTVHIFSRYGTTVFYTKGAYVPWDGKINGKDAPAGTYYYMIDVPEIKEKFTGWLLLVR